ncbi:leucine-rich repeat-containing protein 68-like [Lentinula edodes]|uniref:Leucine-rich repeat-containing protein 68-like n=1 Tax=Lentinula edodes TaxID=5353 RepID=A0A1Q3ES90_LENED|nr:leucine-rich repeat-containing protein 68-like [Lentinula edodes]
MASSPISPPPLASPNPLSSPNVPSPIPNSSIPSSPSFSPHPTPPVRCASTSSVTIPIPGKSILKKPPPPPTGLLSRITSGISVNGIGGMSMGGLGKFFGSGTGGNATSSVNSNLATIPEPPTDTVPSSFPPLNPALKRAHFILPHMAVVYPISSSAPPRTPTTQMEKKAVENREREILKEEEGCERWLCCVYHQPERIKRIYS